MSLALATSGLVCPGSPGIALATSGLICRASGDILVIVDLVVTAVDENVMTAQCAVEMLQFISERYELTSQVAYVLETVVEILSNDEFIVAVTVVDEVDVSVTEIDESEGEVLVN